MRPLLTDNQGNLEFAFRRVDQFVSKKTITLYVHNFVGFGDLKVIGTAAGPNSGIKHVINNPPANIDGVKAYWYADEWGFNAFYANSGLNYLSVNQIYSTVSKFYVALNNEIVTETLYWEEISESMNQLELIPTVCPPGPTYPWLTRSSSL